MAGGAHDHGMWHRFKGRLKRAVGWFTADRHVEAAGDAELRAGRKVHEGDIARSERHVKARYGERGRQSP